MKHLKYAKGIVLFSLSVFLLEGCLGSSSAEERLLYQPFFRIEQRNAGQDAVFRPFLAISAGNRLASVEVTNSDGTASRFAMLKRSDYVYESAPFETTAASLNGTYLIALTPVIEYIEKAEQEMTINIEAKHVLGELNVTGFTYENDRITFSWDSVPHATAYGFMVAYEEQDSLGGAVYNEINNRFFVKYAGAVPDDTYTIGVREELLYGINSGVKVRISAVAVNNDHSYLYRIGKTRTYIKGNSDFEPEE